MICLAISKHNNNNIVFITFNYAWLFILVFGKALICSIRTLVYTNMFTCSRTLTTDKLSLGSYNWFIFEWWVSRDRLCVVHQCRSQTHQCSLILVSFVRCQYHSRQHCRLADNEYVAQWYCCCYRVSAIGTWSTTPLLHAKHCARICSCPQSPGMQTTPSQWLPTCRPELLSIFCASTAWTNVNKYFAFPAKFYE